MSRSEARTEVVQELAEEFLQRYRNGERPGIEEYVNRHPELAGEIREVFPAMATKVNITIRDDSLTGDETGDHGRPILKAPVPVQLGDFRIIREIGRGGMGVVYAAEQVSLGRKVALKVLSSQLILDSKQRRRFEREARAAAKLHHTNIVPVFGVGEHEGSSYYVMQYIEGRGLDQVIEELRQTSVVLPGERSDGRSSRGGAGAYWQSVARIGVQVAEALEYAHNQGILHRDIKPSNLLLDGQGTVWVTDLGLAKADDQENLTHTGDILGTLRYMPPEAFEGKFDARGDVYALGLTLFELLALRPAFDDKDRNRLVKRVMHESPDRLEQLNREIPRDLATIVHKAIAREPVQRYSDAQALRNDLGRFIEGRPIQARRISAPERTWRWCRRNPVIAGLLVAMVVALAGVFGLWLRSERLLALTREQAFGLRLDQAVALCEQGYVDRGVLAMAEQLKDYRRSPAAEQYAIRANLAAWSPHLIAPERLADGILAVKGVPNAQYRLFATIDLDGNPQVWDFATGKLAEKGLEPIGAARQTPSGKTPPLPSLWFSDDGKILIGSAGDGFVRLWNFDTGRFVGPPIPVRNFISELALSEDHRLMATRYNDDVQRWDVTTGRPVKTAWPPERSPVPKAVALYRHRVVTRDESGVYEIHDLDSGKRIGRPMTSAKDSELESVKERKALLIRWDEKNQKSWFQAWSVETGEPLGPPWFADSKKQKRISRPDGSRSVPRGFSRSNLVLALGDTILVCDIATGNPLGEPIQIGGSVNGIEIKREEKLLVYTDQEVQIWDLPTRRRIGEVSKFGKQSYLADVSSDAHRVLLLRNSLEVWDVPTANRRLALSSRYWQRGSVGSRSLRNQPHASLE